MKAKTRRTRIVRGKKIYGYAGKRTARKAWLSLAFFGAAFLLVAGLLFAVVAAGETVPRFTGALGFAAQLLAVLGARTAKESLHEPSRAYGFSYLMLALNVVLAAALAVLYLVGLFSA